MLYKNRFTSIILLSIIMISIIVIPVKIFATISVSPGGGLIIYPYGATSGTPSNIVTVKAGENVSIYLSGVSISGTALWLVISPSPSNDIILSRDAVIVGLFFVSHVTDTTTLHNYTFTPDGYMIVDGQKYTIGKVYLPFSQEGRNYTFTVGNYWINGTMPFMVVGSQDYWLKITDIDPETAQNGYIPPSDVAVSINSLRFEPNFDFKTANGLSSVVPQEPITVIGYAIPLQAAGSTYDLYVNITENGEVVAANVTGTLRTTNGWNWTGFVKTINALDLGLKAPNTSGTINVEVINATNNNGTLLASRSYTQDRREVWMSSNDATHPLPLTLFNDWGQDYSSDTTLWLYTGVYYNITLYNFPYEGSFSIEIKNATYGITKTFGPYTLYANGSARIELRIPVDIKSGSYIFTIKDNDDIVYNFTVYIKVVPSIEAVPSEGQVDSIVEIKGYNFYDYIGKTLTIKFEVNDAGVEVLVPIINESGTYPNFTVTNASWVVKIRVPIAAGGSRTITVYYNTTSVASTTFTVLPKIEVIPSEFVADGRTVIVNCTGFNPYTEYWVNIDNHFLALGYATVTPDENGTIIIKFIAAGFSPGLHVIALYPFGTPYAPAFNATFTVLGPTPKDINESLTRIENSLNLLKITIDKIDENVVELNTSIGTIKTSISDLKDLINKLGDTLELKIDNLNSSLVQLIIRKGDEVVGRICTKLDMLNATIIDIRNDTVIIKTTLGNVIAKLDDIKKMLTDINGTLLVIQGNVAKLISVTGSISASIDDLKVMITQLGDRIELKLSDVNSSLAQLIIKKGDEVVGTLSTKLEDLDAKITDVSNNVVTISTKLGDVKTTIDDLKNGQAEIKDLIKTKSGDIVAVIDTAKGDILAELSTVEDLIKNGVKVDTENILAKIDELKSSVGTVSDKLDALAASLDNVKSSLDDIKSSVSAVKSSVEDVKSSVTSAISSAVDNLKTTIEDKANSVSGSVSTYGLVNLILILIAIILTAYVGFFHKKE